MIESACSGERTLYGPATYYKCVRGQIAALKASAGEPDLSKLSSEEQGMIESACSGESTLYGPAAYYKCVRGQVAALARDYSLGLLLRIKKMIPLLHQKSKEGIENEIAAALKKMRHGSVRILKIQNAARCFSEASIIGQ